MATPYLLHERADRGHGDKGQAARGRCTHNNHDWNFLTDVSREKAGLATANVSRWADGVVDYNNDGWPDIYLTCMVEIKLFQNSGERHFHIDVTKQDWHRRRPLSTAHRSGDYDGDGNFDLMVTNLRGFPPERFVLGFGHRSETASIAGLTVHSGRAD